MSRSYVSLLQKFRTLLTSNGKLVQKNKSSAMYLMLNAVCRFWLVFSSIFQAHFFCIHCKLEMRYEKRQTQSEKKHNNEENNRLFIGMKTRLRAILQQFVGIFVVCLRA